MLYIHFTEKLLGLQGVKITNIESIEKASRFMQNLKEKPYNCTSCGTVTSTIHDYQTQHIKNNPAFGKLGTIVLRKHHFVLMSRHFSIV